MACLWSFSGGAAKFIGLAEAARVSMIAGFKPDVIVGVSSGCLLTPIIAAAYFDPKILDKAIELGGSLKLKDMFPYSGNFPLNKNGKPSFNAILRLLTGHNHLGFQDIAPLYKKVFTNRVFRLFKKSQIKCYGFGVNGADFSPSLINLNEAKDIDDLIKRIEFTARIVPIVQPAKYNNLTGIDGGFISHSAAYWVWHLLGLKVDKLLSVYANEYKLNIKCNSKWDNNIVSIMQQCLQGTTHYLSIKDRIIEGLYCKANKIPYIRIECPDIAIDEQYETDSSDLLQFGASSRKVAIERWKEFNTL